MEDARIGNLKPRYSLLMNPHAATRLSRCPHCEKLTYPRKFALLIVIKDCDTLVQGKTCKFCSRCQMILVQQDELEGELARSCQLRMPEALGQKYEVMGVVEISAFKAGLGDNPPSIQETLEQVSDIKKYYGLGYSPGGWYPPGKEPPVLPSHREQRIPWKAT